MPPPDLIATPGSASANTYNTAEEADAYFAARLGAGDWPAEGDTRALVLLTATRIIDWSEFLGRRASATQALAFPRIGLWDEDDRPVPTDVIPARVKRGHLELALILLGEDGEELIGDGLRLQDLESVGIGPLNVRLRGRRRGALPDPVRRELAPFLASSGSTFRMERA